MSEVRFPQPGGADSVLDAAAEPGQCLAVLQEENEALGRDLLRSYEQLNLVFEITENIASLRDPDAIQESLLRRFGEMLGAGAVDVAYSDRCVAVGLESSLGRTLELDSERVWTSLTQEIESVRKAHRAHVPSLDEQTRQALDGAHVMLAALRQLDGDAAVVIVLRHRDEPPFDSSDMLATESVLGYGGQVLANVLMMRHLEQMAVETVRALANAIDAKDNYTCGHSERVGWLARMTGAALGLPEPQLEVLEWVGILHDVGKIGVSEQILNKPGKLTCEEYEEMKRHSRMSHEVLQPVARLGPALSGVLHHHENWDGSGYPDGLRGEQIPLFARIIRVVDTFDALTSTRAYRKGFSMERAIEILNEEAGRATDPHVTKVFIGAFERYTRKQEDDFHNRFAHIFRAAGESAAPANAAPQCGAGESPDGSASHSANLEDAVR